MILEYLLPLLIQAKWRQIVLISSIGGHDLQPVLDLFPTNWIPTWMEYSCEYNAELIIEGLESVTHRDDYVNVIIDCPYDVNHQILQVGVK